MLNIANKKISSNEPLKLNNYLNKNPLKVSNDDYNVPAVQQWNNSMYRFNKANSLHDLNRESHLSLLFGSLSSLHYKAEKDFLSFPRLWPRQRRLSVNKTIFANPYIKQTNDKIKITFFIYKRGVKNYLALLKILNKGITNFDKICLRKKFVKEVGRNYYHRGLKDKKDYLFTESLLIYLNRFKENFNSNFSVNNKYLNNFKKHLVTREALKKLLLINFIKAKSLKSNFNLYKDYEIFHKKFANFLFNYECLIFQKEIMTLIIKRYLYIEKFVWCKTFLLPVKIRLQAIYKKKVFFTLVNLKKSYLNSEIAGKILLKRIDKKVGALKYKSYSLFRKIQYNYYDQWEYYKHKLNSSRLEKLYINKKNLASQKDLLTKALTKTFNYYSLTLNGYNYYNILQSFNERTIVAMKLAYKGRLGKRIAASRALDIVHNRGVFKDIDASYRMRSVPAVRGNLKSNLAYMAYSSATRVGAYGIKGWFRLS